MPRTGSYGVNAKNSNILSTLPANDKAVFFSWHTAAKVYQFLSWGLLDGVTEEDAKGYTKYLLLFLSAVTIGGLMEGGAL